MNLRMDKMDKKENNLSHPPSRPKSPTESPSLFIRHGEMRYSWTPPATLDEWLYRRQELKRQILTAAGLYPLPPRQISAEKVHREIAVRGSSYIFEKVWFETLPGLYLTGNLYRPLPGESESGGGGGSEVGGGSGGGGAGAGGVDGPPWPGVLNPHGHWPGGRLHDDAVGSVPKRCLWFATHGYVAFSYDMVGYVDNPLPEHRFADRQLELWSVTPFGLQLANSLYALDFLLSLPFVDPERIGCTGASGGGTQTFFLTAVDERVKVAAPVNMISAHFQGGCVCENAPGLRWGTQNMEIAAMAAPRPLIMVATTGDWTCNTPAVEFPAIRRVYALYGAEDRLQCVQYDAPHNYNQASRQAVYAFFNKYLKKMKSIPGAVGDADTHETAEPVEEEIPELPPLEQLRIFPPGKERPKSSLQLVVAAYKAAGDKQAGDKPVAGEGEHRQFREREVPCREGAVSNRSGKVRSLLTTIFGAGRIISSSIWVDEWSAEPAKNVELQEGGKDDQDYPPGMAVIVKGAGDVSVKVRHYRPSSDYGPHRKANSGREPVLVAALEAGLEESSPLEESPPLDKSPRLDELSGLKAVAARCRAHLLWLDHMYASPEIAGLEPEDYYAGSKGVKFFTTFNPTGAVRRVQAVLLSLKYAALISPGPCFLIATGKYGLPALFAWALLSKELSGGGAAAALDLMHIEETDEHYNRLFFVPGVRKAGGVPAALSLAAATSPLWLRRANEEYLHQSVSGGAPLFVWEEEVPAAALAEQWLQQVCRYGGKVAPNSRLVMAGQDFAFQTVK